MNKWYLIGNKMDNTVTDKQLETIKLFALGYGLNNIAKKQHVSTSTIRAKLKILAKRFPVEFSNACGIRNAYKRCKYNLEHPINVDTLYI